MLTIYLAITIDASTDDQSANDIGEHLKNVVWREVYENLQMPATAATASAERG